MRERSLAILHGIPGKDFRSEIERLFYWVRDNIRYTRDVRGVETVQSPEKTLEYRQGDCDDQCTLLAAMLESVGHPARFVAVGFRPHHFSHVYVEVHTPRGWVALDPTENVAVGWAPPNPVTRMVVEIP